MTEMTEREKVLYDVAKLMLAAHYSPKEAWDHAEAFYEEMLKRLGDRGETQAGTPRA
jgi:hypothetical protein